MIRGLENQEKIERPRLSPKGQIRRLPCGSTSTIDIYNRNEWVSQLIEDHFDYLPNVIFTIALQRVAELEGVHVLPVTPGMAMLNPTPGTAVAVRGARGGGGDPLITTCRGAFRQDP
jgi:hypothetical protein